MIIRREYKLETHGAKRWRDVGGLRQATDKTIKPMTSLEARESIDVTHSDLRATYRMDFGSATVLLKMTLKMTSIIITRSVAVLLSKGY